MDLSSLFCKMKIIESIFFFAVLEEETVNISLLLVKPQLVLMLNRAWVLDALGFSPSLA